MSLKGDNLYFPRAFVFRVHSLPLIYTLFIHFYLFFLSTDCFGFHDDGRQ